MATYVWQSTEAVYILKWSLEAPQSWDLIISSTHAYTLFSVAATIVFNACRTMHRRKHSASAFDARTTRLTRSSRSWACATTTWPIRVADSLASKPPRYVQHSSSSALCCSSCEWKTFHCVLVFCNSLGFPYLAGSWCGRRLHTRSSVVCQWAARTVTSSIASM